MVHHQKEHPTGVFFVGLEHRTRTVGSISKAQRRQEKTKPDLQAELMHGSILRMRIAVLDGPPKETNTFYNIVIMMFVSFYMQNQHKGWFGIGEIVQVDLRRRRKFNE